MIKYLLQGLLFGIAYVAPIGTQNLYVINTASQKSRLQTLKVALITVLFDISLAMACFFGVGLIVEKHSVLKGAILLLGSAAVIWIGASLFRSSPEMNDCRSADDSTIKTAAACFAVTWLNPQAIVDGSLLLGGLRASLPEDMSKYFILGVCIASFLWFNTLALFVSRFRSKFAGAIRWINKVCGTVLIFYGFKLGLSFFQMFIL
jgi:L-lysine exporter family protein LysE/ArgO